MVVMTAARMAARLVVTTAERSGETMAGHLAVLKAVWSGSWRAALKADRSVAQRVASWDAQTADCSAKQKAVHSVENLAGQSAGTKAGAKGTHWAVQKADTLVALMVERWAV